MLKGYLLKKKKKASYTGRGYKLVQAMAILWGSICPLVTCSSFLLLPQLRFWRPNVYQKKTLRSHRVQLRKPVP